MTQLQMMRVIFWIVRRFTFGVSRRDAFFFALNSSMWLHRVSCPVHSPRLWWKYRRSLALMRRGIWELKA